MPTYEYACTSCGHEWEQEQRIVEPALDTCPSCHQKTAKRLVSAGNFILKGGGWYADLYSKPGSGGGGGSSGKTSASSNSKVESRSSSEASSASTSSSSTAASATSSSSSSSSPSTTS